MAGFTGEQYALPEAVEQLGHVTKLERTEERVDTEMAVDSDRVRVEIDFLGYIENQIVTEHGTTVIG